MYVDIARTRQRILASYWHNYKLRKLVFSVSKNLFFTPLNKIRMPLFVSLDDIFFVQFFTNITAMLCARYPWNFLQRFKIASKNAIWKCDLKMRKNAKKTFFHVQIRWCWMWDASWNFNWKVYFLSEILWLSYLVLITQN